MASRPPACYLAGEHQIKIAAGFGPYKQSVIRIGHMGNAVAEADVEQLLTALREYIRTAAAR